MCYESYVARWQYNCYVTFITTHLKGTFYTIRLSKFTGYFSCLMYIANMFNVYFRNKIDSQKENIDRLCGRSNWQIRKRFGQKTAIILKVLILQTTVKKLLLLLLLLPLHSNTVVKCTSTLIMFILISKHGLRLNINIHIFTCGTQIL